MAGAGLDALVVIFVPVMATRAQDVAASIRQAAERTKGGLPVLTVFVSSTKFTVERVEPSRPAFGAAPSLSCLGRNYATPSIFALSGEFSICEGAFAANRPEGWNVWLTYTLSPSDSSATPLPPPGRPYTR